MKLIEVIALKRTGTNWI